MYHRQVKEHGRCFVVEIISCGGSPCAPPSMIRLSAEIVGWVSVRAACAAIADQLAQNSVLEIQSGRIDRQAAVEHGARTVGEVKKSTNGMVSRPG